MGHGVVGLSQPVSSRLRATHPLPQASLKGSTQELQKHVLASEPRLLLLRADGDRSPLSTLLACCHSLNSSQCSTEKKCCPSVHPLLPPVFHSRAGNYSFSVNECNSRSETFCSIVLSYRLHNAIESNFCHI